MLTYCKTKDVLDSVMLEITNPAAAIRTRALAWLNQAIRDVLNQPREWRFLQTGVTLTITNNQATMPYGAAEIVNITIGDTFYEKEDQLSDMDALDGNTPGFTRSSAGVLTFYPAATGTCVLQYEAGLDTKYTDSTSNTIFPIQFENCLIAGTLMRYFMYDKDARLSAATTMFDYQLKLVKAWDNTLKP